MSYATDDENTFYLGLHHVSASIKLTTGRAGHVILEVSSDVREVQMSPRDVRALMNSLEQNVGDTYWLEQKLGDTS